MAACAECTARSVVLWFFKLPPKAPKGVRFAPTMKVSENGQANLAWEAFHELRDAPFNSRQFVASSHS